MSAVNNPRSILLPPYMLNNSLWSDLCDATDALFQDTDSTTAQLRALRDPFATGPVIRSKVSAGSLYDTASAEYQQDLNVLLKQLSFLGMPLTNPGFLQPEQALSLFRHLGEYWFSKGTPRLIDLLNYTLGSTITMESMWTSDYVTFVPESVVKASPGTYPPITGSGGSWYPTTHVTVNLGSSSVFDSLSVNDFVVFFNDLFNYNLVLWQLSADVTVAISSDAGLPGYNLGLYVEEEFFVYGGSGGYTMPSPTGGFTGSTGISGAPDSGGMIGAGIPNRIG